MDKALFLFHAGRAYPRLERWSLRRSNAALSKAILRLAHALAYRRNPRSREYMERLAQQVFPDFAPQQTVVVEAAQPLAAMDWDTIGEIVLLWPDANGTGWARIEREVFRRKRPFVQVTVLNGRRRCFLLSRMVWRGFRWRRFLEKTLALELVFMVAFLAITPWLTLWDLLRGRR